MSAHDRWDSLPEDLDRARRRVEEGERAELEGRVTDRAGYLASMERRRRLLAQLEAEARAREEAEADIEHGGEAA